MGFKEIIMYGIKNSFWARFSRNRSDSESRRQLQKPLLEGQESSKIVGAQHTFPVSQIMDSKLDPDFRNDLLNASTKALFMGFSPEQIKDMSDDEISNLDEQFRTYVIPSDIQNQIDDLPKTGLLEIRYKQLTTGQLCKILKTLNEEQRNALTELYLDNNQLTSLPDSFGRLTALTELYLYNNQLTSLPDSFGSLKGFNGALSIKKPTHIST